MLTESALISDRGGAYRSAAQRSVDSATRSVAQRSADGASRGAQSVNTTMRAVGLQSVNTADAVRLRRLRTTRRWADREV